MLSIVIGFVVFWIFARKLQLSKSIVPAVAIGLSVFISCVHLTLPPENNLRVALGGSLEPWALLISCLLYTSPSPRDISTSRMPSSA